MHKHKKTSSHFFGIGLITLALLSIISGSGLLSGCSDNSSDDDDSTNSEFYGNYTYYQESDNCALTKSSFEIGNDLDRIESHSRTDEYIYLPKYDNSYTYEETDSDDDTTYEYTVSISDRIITMTQENFTAEWSYTITLTFDDEEYYGTMTGEDDYRLQNCGDFNGTFMVN